MFTAFVHCGALELDPEREDVRGRDEHALKLQCRKCFLKAKFSIASLRIYSTHGSWCAFSRVFHGMALLCLCLELSFNTFQVVVDNDELEMWLG